MLQTGNSNNDQKIMRFVLSSVAVPAIACIGLLLFAASKSFNVTVTTAEPSATQPNQIPVTITVSAESPACFTLIETTKDKQTRLLAITHQQHKLKPNGPLVVKSRQFVRQLFPVLQPTITFNKVINVTEHVNESIRLGQPQSLALDDDDGQTIELATYTRPDGKECSLQLRVDKEFPNHLIARL